IVSGGKTPIIAASETLIGTLPVNGRATYSFIAPASGYFEINMAADGSAIDSYLEVYNEGQQRVAYSDNAARDTTDSRVRIRVTAGQTYYVRALATKGTEGHYALKFESQPIDDAGNTSAQAAAMSIAANGSSSKNGNIQYANDTDCFAYTAKYSGLVQTTVAATGQGSVLAAALTVRDAEGNVMGAAQAAGGGSLNLSFTAVQGQTYFLSVSGADSSQTSRPAGTCSSTCRPGRAARSTHTSRSTPRTSAA
ncbi:MAG: hypothetical protein NTU94_18565, partial [Planctomycetota bacterium]|nr:hypothetical protein [Planctomycetota bacterium]